MHAVLFAVNGVVRYRSALAVKGLVHKIKYKTRGGNCFFAEKNRSQSGDVNCPTVIR